ncbi:MAG TPA: class I SAM-dependent methyltransferase [Candidatus Angelobacter sp.]|jgi:2-polyprenyl-3-methyl-5-hydroxy-6-metoxy-1,4-benzoquinol methylase
MANTKITMNYRDQEKFLQGSRIWGGAISSGFFAVALALRFVASGRWHADQTVASLLVAIAVAVLMYYTPDYLHLSVRPERKPHWETKIRWRIAGAALVLGITLAPGTGGRIFAVSAAVYLVVTNWLALKKIRPEKTALFFWITDLVLLFLSLIRANSGTASILLLALAAAAHVAIVRREDQHLRWAVITFLSGVVIVSFATGPFGQAAFLAGAMLLLVAVAGTVWLVRRAREQSAKNVSAAMAELIEFTGYPPERIRELWATSNRQLAANWQLANPAEDNPEQMAEWYRQNSELYLFDISAYNLEYKRIRSNMKVLRLAKGATLDYGAGNGEILLELARRGHRVAYYDVEGVTMRFARQRAERQKLAIDFFHTKSELAEAARQSGFDTVFSFDVLEHMPDLPGELTFLSSLLGPGGLFVFDVPAGSTKAHPMHLNHNLNVLTFMRAKGLVDERNVMLRLPFRKEEKYVFRAPARETARAIGT